MHYVYLLKLDHEKYYVGQTKDIEARLIKHRKGDIRSTARYEIIELHWYAAFVEKHKANEFEKYLKSGSGRTFRDRRLI